MGLSGGNRRLGKRSRLYEMLLAPLSIRERTVFSTVIILSIIFLAITTAGATNSLVGSYVYSPFSACDSSGGSWSAVLQATGLPDAELAGDQQYGRTARIADGTAPLVCGQAHVSHPAALNAGVRLHLATIEQVDDSQVFTEGGHVAEAVLDSPPIYHDTAVSAADIDKFLRVEWSSDDAGSWQPLAEFKLSDLAETVIDLPLPQQLGQGFEEMAIRLTPLSIGDGSADLAIDSVGLTYEVGQPARLEMSALAAGQTEDRLPVFIASQDLSIRLELDSPSTGVAEGLARNLPGTQDNPPEAEITASLVTSDGQRIILDPDSEWLGTELDGDLAWQLYLSPPRELKPGSYTLETAVSADGSPPVKAVQDVLWGVMAINTASSSYRPNQPIELLLSLLDERGATVCDADITAVIRQNGREIEKLSTGDGQVIATDTCEVYGNQLQADYTAQLTLDEPGSYDLEVTASREDLNYRMTDSIQVESEPDFVISRLGPTRLFPVNHYPMEISISFNRDFNGSVVEYLPASFELVSAPNERPYTVEEDGPNKRLIWSAEALDGDVLKFKYTFDAPNDSPAFYTLGKLELKDQSQAFEEHRYWQLAGDAVGHMLLFWDGGTAPAGWSCVSCSPGDPFYQTFIRGSDSYGGSGGGTSHSHTYTADISGSNSSGNSENFGSGSVASNAHTHSLSETFSPAGNLPSYRQLNIIRHDTAGEPANLPAGAIAIFESTGLPGGWTSYSAQDGYFIRGEATAGSTGGSNSHSHSISATIGNASGATHGSRGGGTQVTAATATHNHTVSGNTSSVDSQPPFIEVVLGELGSLAPVPSNMVAMWDEELPAGWLPRSSSTDPYYQRFIKAANGFGTTGGTASHSHEDTELTTTGASATSGARSGSSGAPGDHTHTVGLSGYNTVNHLPPYRDVVIGKKQEPSTYDQSGYRWFRNVNDTDIGLALAPEDAPAQSLGLPWRLRIAISVGDNQLGQSGESFKLQYAQKAGTCDAAFSGETYIDLSPSSGVLRYFDNSSADSGDALSSNLNDPAAPSGSAANQTYVEANNFTNSQSAVDVGDYALWDFAVFDHSAPTSTAYCFRVVKASGDLLENYSVIPEIMTDDGSGHMVVLYNGGGVPASWTCVSCNPGEPFYQRFVRGSASYGSMGGADNHGHTASASVSASTDSSGGSASTGSTVSAVNHGHTASAALENSSNLPSYRQLKFIRYDSAGSPETLPANVIALFDSALPSGWTRYSAQDGFYIRGENTSGVTGGSNTHSHATAGATSSPSGGMVGTGGGGPGSAGAGAAHTHSLAGSSSSANHEPPFIETVLGELGSAEAPPAGIITFWDGTPPGAWDVLSDSGGDFYQRFIKGAANYGSTGGSASHTHANYNAATGSPSSAVNTNGSGNGSGSGHTHSVAISSVSDQNHLPPYIEAVIAQQITPNTSPDSPANLSQYRVTLASQISVGGFSNEDQIEFRAQASDSDNPDTLELCVEAAPLGDDFTGTELNCGNGVAYSGSPVSVSVTITGLANTEEYHWQARIRDGAGAYSSWTSFGGNAENEVDFAVDTVAATGTVYDGTTEDVDVDFNDGTLNQLEANWDAEDDLSGLASFEYSVGTSPGATDILDWTNNGLSDSATASSLSLNTSEVYYFNVRATDEAGNAAVISTDGIRVAPTLSFSASPTLISFDNLNVSNSYTASENAILTTSTNAYNGYQIRAFISALPTADNLSTVALFNGGTYAAPDTWQAGDTGYGYTSNDDSIDGNDIFNSTPCPGGGNPPCWAPFALAPPGDIVADHTQPIVGTPLSNQNFVITHRVTVSPSKPAGVYRTEIIYSITARY